MDLSYWRTKEFGVPFGIEQYEEMVRVLAELKGKAIISLNDHPDTRLVFADYHIETTDIRYTVGGGKGSDANEVLIFSWDVEAEPAELFRLTRGMGMEIGAAVTAVKGALDLARTAKDVNDQAQLNAAMSDIMDKLITAQSDLIELLNEHYRLTNENKELKSQVTKAERFDRYRLEKTPAGDFIMRLKEEWVNEDSPAHVICYLCKEEGKLTPMSENTRNFYCPTCKHVSWVEHQSVRSNRSGW